MIYKTTDLINAIKRNAAFPTSQVRFSNDDFLTFLNEELQLTLVSHLVTMRQDYFVTTVDTALVASQTAYTIPVSAIGWKVESVGYIDSSDVYTKIPMITRDQRSSFSSLSSSSIPSAFYILNNSINLVPDAGSSVSGSLRFDLVRIQNELVMDTTSGNITAVTDTGTDYQMTVGTLPISSGDSCDVISGTNPFNIIARGVTSSILGSVVTVTYSSDFSRAPVLGDYVCKAGTTPIPNIPEDIHPILAQLAVVRVLAATNDIKGIQSQGIVVQNMLNVLKQRASSRVSDAPRKIVPNNYVLNMMRRCY